MSRTVQITIPLPQPAQSGAVAREVSVSADGHLLGTWDVVATLAQHVVDAPRNATVTYTIADIDAAGNRGKELSGSVLAVTAPQLPEPAAALQPATVAEIAVTAQPTIGSLGHAVGGGSFVRQPGQAP